MYDTRMPRCEDCGFLALQRIDIGLVEADSAFRETAKAEPSQQYRDAAAGEYPVCFVRAFDLRAEVDKIASGPQVDRRPAIISIMK